MVFVSLGGGEGTASSSHRKDCTNGKTPRVGPTTVKWHVTYHCWLPPFGWRPGLRDGSSVYRFAPDQPSGATWLSVRSGGKPVCSLPVGRLALCSQPTQDDQTVAGGRAGPNLAIPWCHRLRARFSSCFGTLTQGPRVQQRKKRTTTSVLTRWGLLKNYYHHLN